VAKSPHPPPSFKIGGLILPREETRKKAIKFRHLIL
jgi:hypothetical protein